MRCPVCSIPLKQVKTRSAVVDMCPRCKGIWFDAGELVDFVKPLSQSDKVSPEKIKLFKRRNVRPLYKFKEKNRLCPRCGKKLQTFNYSCDSNVFLDRCSECGGIWADKGEATAIAAYLKEDPYSTSVGKGLIYKPDLEQNGAAGGWFVPLRIIVPLSDDMPRKRLPVITVGLIVLCIVISVCDSIFNPDALVEAADFKPEDVFSVDLVASIFSHGGIFHLVWNMLFLWLFGDNVEDRLGRFWYLCFFIGCAFAAVVSGLIFASASSVWAMGISAAVSAVMGAYFIFYPAAKLRVLVISSVMEIPAAVCLGLWFLFQFIFPFVNKAENVTFAVNIPPVAGFICGAVIACIKSAKLKR
jgi:membrane associated rhomboid family serine protease/Zn-finger nucleic acid-binding protein